MIGIIAAMQCELARLCDAAENTRKERIFDTEYCLGILDGREVVMAVCGEGKVNAATCAQTMLLRYAPQAIVVTGVAGSLSPTLHVPDVAIATATAQHDYDLSPLGYEKSRILCGYRDEKTPNGDKETVFFPTLPALREAFAAAAQETGVHAECGVIATGDQFVASSAVKQDLHQRLGAIACEMESGAIAQVCAMAATPYCVLRAISDNADEHAPATFSPEKAAEISVALTRRALALWQGGR